MHAQPPTPASVDTQPKQERKLRTRRAYNPASEVVRNFELQVATGLSPTTIWRLRKAGNFPRPIKLGENSIGWRRAEICAWLASRIEASR